MMETTFNDKCEILGELWLNFRNDGDFDNFIDIHDVALPLAYLLSKNISAITPEAEQMVNDTWLSFLETLAIEDDGYQSLGEVMIVASEENEE